MAIEWVDKIGKFKVERREIPRLGGKPYFLNSSTIIGVLHTTEIQGVENSWELLNERHSAPHFVTGEGRILQCRTLNVQGATLAPGNGNTANVHAQIQIEMVANSKEELWLPESGTLEPTVAIMAFCRKHLGIPLRAPNNWPDDCSDVPSPWAANNRRRKQAAKGLWPIEKGWWMHMEVPHQGKNWHWDCGALQRSSMIVMASVLLPKL
jgi:hypothetical protein